MKPEIKESLGEYVKYGCPTGGFLRAVLANDFMEAVGRADEESIRDIREIAGYVYNKLLGNCHGSYKTVDRWIERFRAKREAANAAQ